MLGKKDPKWYSTQSPSWENHFAFPDGENDEFFLERKRKIITSCSNHIYMNNYFVFIVIFFTYLQ